MIREGYPVRFRPGYYWHRVGGSDVSPTLMAMPGRPRMRGAGDVVARVTGAVGIRPCAPCERRRRKLNRWFPFS